MSIRLNGSTSGYVEIDAPAVAGSTSITLPATSGGEVVVTDSSGNIDLGPLDINGSAADDSVKIDASGRLLVGTATNIDANSKLQIESDANDKVVLKATSAVANNGSQVNWYVGSTWKSAIYGGNDNSSSSVLTFSTTADGGSSPTERMRISQNGLVSIPGVYSFTTAAAANVYVESAGQLSRATSSSKYKTDIETLDDAYSDALLSCRPVWYRSTCEADNPDWGWWGFIAEEVAQIDPRLVHWKTKEVSYDEKGAVVTTPCDPEPEGVQYERFVPHLLNLIKRQKERIETLEAANASFEARLTALEGGQP